MDGCEPICEKFTAKNIEGMRHKHFENSGFLSSPKTSSLVPKKKERNFKPPLPCPWIQHEGYKEIFLWKKYFKRFYSL